MSLTAQSKFNLLLGSLQAEFENDRKTLETERNNLMQQLHGARYLIYVSGDCFTWHIKFCVHVSALTSIQLIYVMLLV